MMIELESQKVVHEKEHRSMAKAKSLIGDAWGNSLSGRSFLFWGVINF